MVHNMYQPLCSNMILKKINDWNNQRKILWFHKKIDYVIKIKTKVNEKHFIKNVFVHKQGQLAYIYIYIYTWDKSLKIIKPEKKCKKKQIKSRKQI